MQQVYIKQNRPHASTSYRGMQGGMLCIQLFCLWLFSSSKQNTIEYMRFVSVVWNEPYGGDRGIWTRTRYSSAFRERHVCQFHQIPRGLPHGWQSWADPWNQDRIEYSSSHSSCWPGMGLGLPDENEYAGRRSQSLTHMIFPWDYGCSWYYGFFIFITPTLPVATLYRRSLGL